MAKTCFIISSIGKEDSETRKLADEKFELIFEPVLKELGYKVTRSDKIGSPGSISRDIVNHIINSDMVIADVSDENPNVFYELAIRNAAKKAVVVCRRINQQMPFDIYDKRAISIDRANPRIWENAKKALKIHIQEAEKNPKIASDSILTNFSFDLEYATNETDQMYYILRDIQQKVMELSKSRSVSRVEKIPRKIQSPASYEHIVSVTPGSSVPGCEKTNDCFDPPILEIKQGETVLWANEDTAAHTVTSGTAVDGPDGNFDSSLFMAGNTFSYKFDLPGEFLYFDMVHPWMAGTIIVK